MKYETHGNEKYEHVHLKYSHCEDKTLGKKASKHVSQNVSVEDLGSYSIMSMSGIVLFFSSKTELLHYYSELPEYL